mgnify:CR=1 FL=1
MMYLFPKITEIRERRLAADLSQHGLSLKPGLGAAKQPPFTPCGPGKSPKPSSVGLRIFLPKRKEPKP